jgi:hypothetical protein
VLTVLEQKLAQLDQEATQCLGQSVYEPGASQVVTTIPGNVATAINPSSTTTQPPAPATFTTPPTVLQPISPNF